MGGKIVVPEADINISKVSFPIANLNPSGLIFRIQ
jgi:hypothetical protein